MNFWGKIQKPIIGLAPMDGVTDAPFRFITAKHGKPDVTLTEFVNIQSALHSPQTLLKDLTYSEIERPIVASVNDLACVHEFPLLSDAVNVMDATAARASTTIVLPAVIVSVVLPDVPPATDTNVACCTSVEANGHDNASCNGIAPR